MSKLDLLKLLESFEGEAEIADFSPDELQELIERMKNGDEPLPTTKEAFKEKYYAYYDDIKDPTRKKQDW
jgi:hypothetical protein